MQSEVTLQVAVIHLVHLKLMMILRHVASWTSWVHMRYVWGSCFTLVVHWWSSPDVWDWLLWSGGDVRFIVSLRRIFPFHGDLLLSMMHIIIILMIVGQILLLLNAVAEIAEWVRFFDEVLVNEWSASLLLSAGTCDVREIESSCYLRAKHIVWGCWWNSGNMQMVVMAYYVWNINQIVIQRSSHLWVLFWTWMWYLFILNLNCFHRYWSSSFLWADRVWALHTFPVDLFLQLNFPRWSLFHSPHRTLIGRHLILYIHSLRWRRLLPPRCLSIPMQLRLNSISWLLYRLLLDILATCH